MAFLALPWWLVLYCHVNGIRTSFSKSTCPRPLGSFVSCYDVVPPLFTANLFNVTYRRVQPQPSLTFSALGRRFSLRLQRDDSDSYWSSVVAPSAVVQVVSRHGIVRRLSFFLFKLKTFLCIKSYPP